MMLKMMAQSPSSLAMFKSCPAQYKSKYIERTYVDEPSAALEEGKYIHDLLDKGLKGFPVPPEFPSIQRLVNLLLSAKEQGYEVYSEIKLASTEDRKPCAAFFSKDAYLRCVIDVLVINPERTKAIVIDWKTGKTRDYKLQEAINTECVLVHFGYTLEVSTFFAFLKYDEAITQTVPVGGNRLMTEMREALQEIRQAHATGNFPPNPSGLCRAWCGNFFCEFNERRQA